MRQFILLVLAALPLYGQQPSIEESVAQVEQIVDRSEGAEKLKWLDSLTKLTRYNSELKFDSIVRRTIDHAYAVDSIDTAIWQTGDLIFYYANRVNNAKEGAVVFDEFRKRDVKSENYKLLAQVYTNGGDSYYFSGKTMESTDIYEIAENFALKANDSIKYALARSYKSAPYSISGDYATASKLLLETAQIFQREKDTANLLFVRNELATLYSKIGFNEEAKKERDEVLDLSRHMHLDGSLVPNLFNAALEQHMLGNQVSRIAYLKEAYEHVNEPDYKHRLKSIVEYGLLGAYSVTDSLDKAKKFFDKIQSTHAKLEPIPFESHYRTALADYYIATKDFNKAVIEGEWVLNYHKRKKNIWGTYHMDERLSQVYEALGDVKKSYAHYTDFVTLRDSVNSVKKAKGLSYYQTLYETEKRDFKISSQASEIELLDKQNTIKRQWLLFGGSGLILIFAIIYLIRSRNFSRKEKQNQEHFSQELIKAQEEQRTIVGRDLHDSVGQKLMLLTKKVKTFNDTDVDDLAKNTLEELRGISRQLYPATFEQVGVTASIRSMINEIDANTDLFFTCEIDDIDGTLSDKSALHLYRIIQEVLNNVVKHAKAKSVVVSIVKGADAVETTVRDNGIGFEFSEKLKTTESLGMKTLLERAKIIRSKLSINSIENKGTTMQLITPIS